MGHVIDFFVVVKSVVMLSTVIRRNLTSLDPLHSYFLDLNGNYIMYYTVYTGCSFENIKTLLQEFYPVYLNFVNRSVLY